MAFLQDEIKRYCVEIGEKEAEIKGLWDQMEGRDAAGQARRQKRIDALEAAKDKLINARLVLQRQLPGMCWLMGPKERRPLMQLLCSLACPQYACLSCVMCILLLHSMSSGCSRATRQGTTLHSVYAYALACCSASQKRAHLRDNSSTHAKSHACSAQTMMPGHMCTRVRPPPTTHPTDATMAARHGAAAGQGMSAPFHVVCASFRAHCHALFVMGQPAARHGACLSFAHLHVAHASSSTPHRVCMSLLQWPMHQLEKGGSREPRQQVGEYVWGDVL